MNSGAVSMSVSLTSRFTADEPYRPLIIAQPGRPLSGLPDMRPWVIIVSVPQLRGALRREPFPPGSERPTLGRQWRRRQQTPIPKGGREMSGPRKSSTRRQELVVSDNSLADWGRKEIQIAETEMP